jgi:hypothetical protein
MLFGLMVPAKPVSDEMEIRAEYPFDVFDGLFHSPPRTVHPNELPAGWFI